MIEQYPLTVWASYVQKGGNLFEKGDFIFYGAVGVCQVDGISKPDFSDNDKLYYRLIPKFEPNRSICIPVDTTKVLMRCIMTRREAQNFILSWPNVQCKGYRNDKERPLIYKQIFQSGSCTELAAMIKEILQMEQSRKSKGNALNIRERDGVKTARKLLFGELAAALDIGPDMVPAYIHNVTGCAC